MPVIFDDTIELTDMFQKKYGLEVMRNYDSSIGDYRLFYTIDEDTRPKWARWLLPRGGKDQFESINDTKILIPRSRWEEWYPKILIVAREFEQLTNIRVTITKTKRFIEFDY